MSKTPPELKELIGAFAHFFYRHLSLQTLAEIFDPFILDKTFSPLYILSFGDFNQQEIDLRKLQR